MLLRRAAGAGVRSVGHLVHAWGGPGAGYEWPEVEHGIHVDANDFVWLGGSGAKDAQVLKFTLEAGS